MTKEKIINEHLCENENVLWSGVATKIKLFTKADIIIVPLTIIFAIFVLAYVYSAFMLMIKGQSAAFALSGITCLLVMFYLLFGRIWYRKKKLSKSIYFVTDKRLFVFNTFRNNVLCDIPLECSDAFVKGNDLFLTAKSSGSSLASALGLDLFLYNIVHETPAFYSVENPESILKIINKAKNNRKADKNDTNFI